jgi:hypothetical protein
MRRSFRFLDHNLQSRLVALLEANQLPFKKDKKWGIVYSAASEKVVGEMISSIRSQVFPAWQVLSCPADWVVRYREYMRKRKIPFHEELINGQACFLLSRAYHPHRWKKL